MKPLSLPRFSQPANVSAKFLIISVRENVTAHVGVKTYKERVSARYVLSFFTKKTCQIYTISSIRVCRFILLTKILANIQFEHSSMKKLTVVVKQSNMMPRQPRWLSRCVFNGTVLVHALYCTLYLLNRYYSS